MSTPHILSKKEDIAKIVLMPGDPNRAKFFVENYMTDYKVVNEVRGMNAYTGYLNGVRVTVFPHGMGLESIGIYSYELYKFYDVDTIIRFGSCGTYDKDINLFDIVVADKAFSTSNYGLGFGYNKEIIEADKDLVEIFKNEINNLNLDKISHYSTVNSSMWFYKTDNHDDFNWFVDKKIPFVEMEAYSLYLIAKRLNKKSLTILTVSDNIPAQKFGTTEQREKGFKDMFSILKNVVKKIG